MQPLQSPNVSMLPSTWSCPPTNSSPRTLPDFRPQAAAQKQQNMLPDPSEHPQTLSQPPLETFLDIPTDFFIPPLKPRPKPRPSLSQAWACCQGSARDVLKPEPKLGPAHHYWGVLLLELLAMELCAARRVLFKTCSAFQFGAHSTTSSCIFLSFWITSIQVATWYILK